MCSQIDILGVPRNICASSFLSYMPSCQQENPFGFTQSSGYSFEEKSSYFLTQQVKGVS